MTPEQELLDTIEGIRASRYAELPADLVKQIVQIERDYTDNRPEAHRRIGQAVDEYLGKQAAGGKG